jgi:hypothetical protein
MSFGSADRPLALDCLKQSGLRKQSLVHEAAWCGHAAVIPILKDAGFNLDAFRNRPRDGFTPLMIAIVRGASGQAAVEALLKAGADPDLGNMIGEKPLVIARDHDLKAIAMVLLRHGASSSSEIEDWIDEPDQQT